MGVVVVIIVAIVVTVLLSPLLLVGSPGCSVHIRQPPQIQGLSGIEQVRWRSSKFARTGTTCVFRCGFGMCELLRIHLCGQRSDCCLTVLNKWSSACLEDARQRVS